MLLQIENVTLYAFMFLSSTTSLLIAAISVSKTIKQRDIPRGEPIFPSDIGMRLQQIEITTAQFHGGSVVVGARIIYRPTE